MSLFTDLEDLAKTFRQSRRPTYRGYPLKWFTGLTHYDVVDQTWYNGETIFTVHYLPWWKRKRVLRFHRVPLPNNQTERSQEAIRLSMALTDWLAEPNTDYRHESSQV